ncbi:MAG: hypothetical protein ACOYI8_06775 [Christensenellales bacterium]|jgi:hypothetical protein
MQKVTVEIDRTRLAVAILLLALAIFGGMGYLAMRYSASKGDTIAFVREHAEMIGEAVRKDNYEEILALKDIRIFDHREDGFVEFLCGGIGFQEIYYGFYHSTYDTPLNIEYGWQMVAQGDGNYWEQKDGHHRYYMEKIEENLYYYEFQ